MAHKKAGGSSRNGRDSESKRLGVKKFGSETVARRQHHRAPARHQVAPGRQRRPGQGPYPFCAYRRPSRVPRRQAWPQIRPRHADYAKRTHRNGQKGTVPTRGRPGRDPEQIESQKGEEGSPRLPFFFVLLPKLSRAAARRPRRRRRDDVRENAKTAAEARLGRGRAGACRARLPTRRSSATWRPRRGPIACATPRPSSPARATRSCRRFLIFERTDGAPQLVGVVRPRPPPVGRGRARLLDRPALSGAAAIATEACAALIDIARDARLAAPRRLALPRQSGVRPGAREARLRAARDHRAAAELRARRRSAGAADAAELRPTMRTSEDEALAA